MKDARTIFLLIPFVIAGALFGACAPVDPRGTDAPATQPPSRSVPLLVANEPVPWEELRPRLAEAAGAAVVEEVVLEHLLRAELERAGLAVTAEDTAREREYFARTLRLSSPAGEDPPTAQLLARVRRARALGPDRFEALLSRSAMLRKVVAADVVVADDDVHRAVEARFGPRVRCRLIVVPTEGEARRLRDRLAVVPADELVSRFIAEARLVSVDPSGARGGEVDPISLADPSYAPVFRQALADLAPGQLSPVIVFERGYAVILGVERVPAATPPPGAEAEAREDVRQRLERAAMDRLAARLLASAPVTVLDPSLNWSWNSRGPAR